MTCEQRGGDGCVPRDGQPISSPDLDSVIGFDALWDSMIKCRGGVMWKGSVASYVLNGLESTSKLSEELHDGTYKPRKTNTFTVTYPKVRVITSTPFRDRVYQRSLNDNVLYPCVARSLIYDNAACQIGKGTDFARNRLKCHIQRHFRQHGLTGWVLIVDIKGYYKSLPHEVGEAVFDAAPDWARDMAVEVLRGQYQGEAGYDPGSQMVQIVGIAALSKLDHYIKERLRIKGYVRYMDDFILIHEDKAVLEHCLEEIRSELAKIGLRVNEGKTRIQRVDRKIPFLGFDFRLKDTGQVVMTIKPESVKRAKRRLRRLVRLEQRGIRPNGTVDVAYEGWRNHASKGDSRCLLIRMDNWLERTKHVGTGTDQRPPQREAA